MVALALLQSVLLARVDLLGARPDLMLLAVLTWAAIRSEREGLIWGFVGGLLIDLLSEAPLGGSSLALVLIAFIAAQPWGRSLGIPAARTLIMALIGTLLYHAILLVVLAWTGHTVHWSYALTRVAAPSALLNTLLAPLVQLPLAWLSRRLRREGLTL